MIKTDKLDKILKFYKEDFETNWANESFKWKAVKCFQDNWDIDAEDFVDMLQKSFAKTESLLAGPNYFPLGMIEEFARASVSETREMFQNLFDENKDYLERIQQFRDKSAEMFEKYAEVSWNNHYQTENSITTYLWLRYPDKYYIYKYSVEKDVVDELDSDYIFKRGDRLNNVKNAKALQDEICSYIKMDDELIKMFKNSLYDECYSDPEYKTLTIDVTFYMSTYYPKRNSQEQIESKIADSNVPEYAWYVGAAGNDENGVYTDFLEKFINEGRWENGWDDKFIDLVNEVKIGDRIAIKASYTQKQNLPFNSCGKMVGVMSIKAIGTVTDNPKDGKNLSVDWKKVEPNKMWYGLGVLRTTIHLVKAKDSNIKEDLLAFTFADAEQDYSIVEEQYLDDLDSEGNADGTINYWWLNANPSIWRFDEKPVGEEQHYTLYNQNGNKRRIFKNFQVAKPGDIILGYESAPVKKVVAKAVVTAKDDEKLWFRKTERYDETVDYYTLKNCPELEKMEFLVNPNGSLFKLTEDEYCFITDMIDGLNPEIIEEFSPYGKKDFLDEVYMSEEHYETVKSVLLRKRNLILQGAPGVGKTYAAERLAYSVMGKKDESRVKRVQFHQNYSYEDFVMGYKPDGQDFKLQEGVFYKFCMKAASHPEDEYFFIIDEINRGNMSKIFGELLMLIENDYRGTDITLAYDGRAFNVPKNLYIIGMMNTADRSLAMIDYALRRRFSFFEMEPGFESDGFTSYQKKFADETFDELISCVERLNDAIAKDSSLGKGFRIGHSYFCGLEDVSKKTLSEIVEFDIIPMLEEYWFDDEGKVNTWKEILRGAVK